MSSGPPKSSVYRKKPYTIEKGLDGVTDYIVIREDNGKVWDLLSNYNTYKTRLNTKYYTKKSAAELGVVEA